MLFAVAELLVIIIITCITAVRVILISKDACTLGLTTMMWDCGLQLRCPKEVSHVFVYVS